MPIWDSTDYDNASSQSGVVHESVANTDHNSADQLQRGYNINSPIESTDLQIYYPMQESSAPTPDFSGNGRDASDINSPTRDAEGILGGSGHLFDGSDDEIRSSYGGPNSHGITLMAWVKPATTSAGIIASTLNTSVSNPVAQYVLRISNGEAVFQYKPGSNVIDKRGGSVSAGVWQLIGGAYDGSTVYIWIDGTQVVNTSADDGGDDPYQFSTDVGSNSYGNFDGNICHFRRYNSALTDTQWQNLYDVVGNDGSLTLPLKAV